jgi:diadenosine tetraphosphatase ApaH/serine/threonine PP2A family protein phosphatase
MKYGIFSDIHSNFEALETVLAYLHSEKCGMFICGGDIIGYGAEPERCLNAVKNITDIMVTGNHEAGYLDDGIMAGFSLRAKKAILWQRETISSDARLFIMDIPMRRRVNGIDIVHASPCEPELFGYVISLEDYMENFRCFEQRICLIGHTHLPGAVEFDEKSGRFSALKEPAFKIEAGKRYLINDGSVGQPRDGDNRACCCTYDDESGIFKFKRLEYNIQSAAGKIIKAGLPEELAERLKYGV